MKKIGYKITKKYLKNKINAHSWSGCAQDSGSITNIEKLRKLLKQKQSHGTYEIAADGTTGGCGHMTNLLTEYKNKVIALLCSFSCVLE